MLLIPCPWCGERNEDEFICGGEASRTRPADPAALGDADWTDYLYNSANHKGMSREWWWHVSGCTRWFRIDRDTVSHEIRPLADPLP